MKIQVNGISCEVPEGFTVLQACEYSGHEIPRFCYHERLAIAGNCRMCLVEVQGMPKLAASCAMQVAEGMSIFTNTPAVKSARESVMSLLLANHPLDCPVCDQGGECDLQDQAMLYGKGLSLFSFPKRAVSHKDFGPLIKTEMTRCIHCTRCIRFLSDISGTAELIAVNRGEDMQIDVYGGSYIYSEVSGNIIDLCPVGALTSAPYAFTARSWELTGYDSIDVTDAVGSNVVLDYKGMEIMRILPRVNDEVNEEWISDKARFSYDGLKLQRLDCPYIRDENGVMQTASWPKVLALLKTKLISSNARVLGLVGSLVNCETLFLFKKLINSLKNSCAASEAISLDPGTGFDYRFATTIARIDEADACLIVGAFPRFDASVMNLRIRQRWLKGSFTIGYIGSDLEHNYPVDYLGDNIKVLEDIAAGQHSFAAVLSAAECPMIIVGEEIFLRDDIKGILSLLQGMKKQFPGTDGSWQSMNVLHRHASSVGAFVFGFVPASSVVDSSYDILYALGADDYLEKADLRDKFVIYQGHHGNVAGYADIVLPGASYVEQTGTYLNTEGRVQRAYAAGSPIGQAWEDWKIVANIAKSIDGSLPDFVSGTSLRDYISSFFPFIGKADAIIDNNYFQYRSDTQSDALQLDYSTPIKFNEYDFYMTNSILRSSRIMARCSKMLNPCKQIYKSIE